MLPLAVNSPLAAIEPRLRPLLPAILYTDTWIEPTSANLLKVFDHLRSLQHTLQDYLPRLVLEAQPQLGRVQYEWQDGTLMFTDLAGFTRMMEAYAAQGKQGAFAVLDILNTYFARMLEIIARSGGNLLEFTGDALLVQFPADEERGDAARAVRAGLRMQRAMAEFGDIASEAGQFALGMRVGLHRGKFMAANIGTPRRMEVVLLGRAVYNAKIAEGAGKVGRVCLTRATTNYIKGQFRHETGTKGHVLIQDNWQAGDGDDYELIPRQRRLARAMIFDRSETALLLEIEKLLDAVEPLASYLPRTSLNQLIESSTRGRVPSSYTKLTVLFVSLIGLPESVGMAREDEEQGLVNSFSRLFALINAIVESRSGLLKKVTYQSSGSNILIYFGAPSAHTDDPQRAVHSAVEIREVVQNFPPITVAGRPQPVVAQMGIATGDAFVVEVGVPRGRREFNVLGDAVNTAARLMAKAEPGAIYVTEEVRESVAGEFAATPLGEVALKGKTAAPIFRL
ncbi:MAG: adenylate/guanylate cyclase domain-containing protein [Chloroflexi bacterium]|nr:adenylate/guanylate cyclase domain-containing protein [Chloroflexota bacterium]